MGTFGIPENQPIENRMISKQLETAQSRIEGFHFDARKQVLAYDNVLNQQRQVVYERRNKLLRGSAEEVHTILAEVVEALPEAEAVIAAKQKEYTGEEWDELTRRLSLQMIDMLWVEHLEVMQYTRASVNLRAYGQRDPLIEYRKEGIRLFGEMEQVLLHRIADVIPNLQPAALAKEEEEMRRARAHAHRAGGEKATVANAKQQPKISEKTYGRNDMVTITNGTEKQELKFKKAESLLEDGEWKLVSQ
jgi:preprotein translocase subunit SecA